ncbi:hypothetical protein I4J89_00480 [Actinoplanes sp. NEAU-A11]|uniref:Uncharacterized protein n=2 Tax=Actinoplanes aureus TaxID=2792083 RepID=A0A931C7V6_9ACTN|nr:hypothetical protein [Actinoplanes aureus]
MMGMAADGLWNWSVAARIDPDLIRGALAGALEQPVHDLVPGDTLLCDVYHVRGDFPTVVDVYLAPSEVAEETIASAVAVRLRAAVLLPDDTLDPSRYVLAEPDGTLRPVHVDERETDDGPERRVLHPCDGRDPRCSRTPERPAAA